MRVEASLNPKIQALVGAREEQGPDFGEAFAKALKEVQGAQDNARDMQTRYMTGEPVEVHDLMIAMERASVAFDLALQVRNKMLEAYQELQRIQV